MGKQESLGAIVKFGNYDILVPFICYKCGKCCHNFAPQIPAEDVSRISQYLNKTSREIEKQHTECYNKKFTSTPADCYFLNNKNQCMIYPLRPISCRNYPVFTDFGANDIECLGHQEFYRVIDAFFNDAGEENIQMCKTKEYSLNKIRTVPNQEWFALWQKFMSAKPSNHMVSNFVSINKVPEEYSNK
ncbi:MAG: YkgJ family cysteine cluster protein [Planctomycetota bacterium]